jgi:signal transduction histidine kinase
LRRTLGGVSGYVNNQSSDLLGVAKLVADDPAIADAVVRGDRQALIIHLDPMYADLNVDIIDVVDARGRILVRMENTVAGTGKVHQRPSLKAALAGHQTVSLEPDLGKSAASGEYALRAFVPLERGWRHLRVLGAVIVGRQLDSLYAARIGRALNANANLNVNLIAGNQRSGTTLTDAHGLPATGLPEPASVLQRITTNKTSIAAIQEDGHATLSGVVPLAGADGRPTGAIEVVSRLDSLYDLIRELSFLLIALGAAVVLLGTVLALAISRRLTARLQELEATASSVAAMAETDAPLGRLHDAVTVHGDDEVASLARSFGAMMDALDDRMAANTRLYEAAQARVRDLTGLAEIARMLTATSSLQETLNKLGEHVCRLVGCKATAIIVPGDGASEVTWGGCGLPDGYERLVNIALQLPGDGEAFLPSHRALLTGEPAWCPLGNLPDNYAHLGAAVDAASWGGASAIPLRLQGRCSGVLVAYTAGDSPMPDSDLSLLTTIADQVAVAVENARLFDRSREVAALEERARLARELHDSVTQGLFSMTMHVRAAQIAMDREGLGRDGRLGRSIVQLRELTQGALAEMRALIFELRPGALSEEGLAAALHKHGAAIQAREGLVVDVEAPEERIPLDARVEENLYRVAQEALHNVVKHAGAKTAIVRVQPKLNGRLVVEIEDNGAGFDPANVPPGHLGVGTMAERLSQVGGELAILSTPGQGTTVRATIPYAVVETTVEPVAQITSTGA